MLRRRGLLAASAADGRSLPDRSSGQPRREAVGPGSEEHRRARAGGQAGDARRSCSRCCCMARSRASSSRRRRSVGTSSERFSTPATWLRARRRRTSRFRSASRWACARCLRLQPRLEHPRGRRALRVLEHPRFRAAYDLLLLRAQHGLASAEMAQWWTRIQEVSAEERGQMADAITGQSQRIDGPPRSGGGGSGGGRRRRRRRRPSGPS